MPSKYASVSVPRELLDRLETLVRDHRAFGYRNKGEAVNAAVRRLVEELEAKLAPPDGTGGPADAERTLDEMLTLLQGYARQKRKPRGAKTTERTRA